MLMREPHPAQVYASTIGHGAHSTPVVCDCGMSAGRRIIRLGRTTRGQAIAGGRSGPPARPHSRCAWISTGFQVAPKDLGRLTTNYTVTAEGLKPKDVPATSTWRMPSPLLAGGASLLST
jgi:hypothetical protein